MVYIEKLRDIFSRYWFGIVVVFVVGFIYLQSPLNQKLIYPNISDLEYGFLKIKFLLYLIWGVLFLVLLFVINKKYKKTIYPFLLFNLGFFFLLSTFNLGFDITDEGWQVAKSWGILHGNLSDNADLIWGSSFLNGLWLSIFNSPSLLWSRVGYLILLPFIPVLNYLLFSKYFPKKTVFFTTLISFLFFYRYFALYSVVNYYYLPVASSLISFWLLSIYHTGEGRTKTTLVLSGIFAGISIHLKFTYVVILPFYILYLYLFTDKKNKLNHTIYYYIATFATILLGFLFLLLVNGAEDLLYEHNRLSILEMIKLLLGNANSSSNLNYSAVNLIGKYINDTIFLTKESFVPVVVLLMTSLLAKKIDKLKFLFVPLLSLFFIFYLQDRTNSHFLFIGILLSSEILMLVFDNDQSKKIIMIKFIALFIFILSFAGSGVSLYAGVFSFGLLSLTVVTISSMMNSRSTVLNFKIIALSIILTMAGLFLKSNHLPYRDLSEKYINTMFKSPELFGIYSFRERVDVVDEFMERAREEVCRESKVIIVSMPMFYYLLDIKPIISETHDVILGFEQLKKEVTESAPNVIIMPVQSPRGHLWPLEKNKNYWKEDGFERTTAHYYDFYRNYISENNFIQIFANNMFLIYKKPIEIGEN